MTTPDPRERLVLAAEELYADRGPGVPLRDIAIAAGQRNNSAVNYHFGSRDGLVEYIVELRTAAMERRRATLLEALTETEPALPALVRILVEPMLTTPYEQGSTHYARFLELVRAHPAVAGWLRGDRQSSATRTLTDRIAAELGHLPRPARRRRIAALSTLLFALAADRERAGGTGGLALGVEEITAILTAALRAGTSA